MATTALVRDANFPSNYHTVIMDHQKFEQSAKKSSDAWKNMSGTTCCGVIGASATITGGIILITGAAHGEFDVTGISIFAVGIILDLITCYACLSKK